MGIREFTKSGKFVLMLLGLAVVGVPFAIEQIGEATDLYRFPVTKTIKGWFAGSPTKASSETAAQPVPWDLYRKDLEKFATWVENQNSAVVSPPTNEVKIVEYVDDTRPKRRIWYVPVTGCTSASAKGRRGYAFVSGFNHPLEEGANIVPSAELCGYEIVYVGDRAVWFRAVFESGGSGLVGRIRLPEFKRVGADVDKRGEKDYLLIGNRKYGKNDAFQLESGGWLVIDSFLRPDGVLFRLLDRRREEVASLLCIVISEKGGR